MSLYKFYCLLKASLMYYILWKKRFTRLVFWRPSLSISCSDLFWFTEHKARTVTSWEVEWTRVLLVTVTPAATVYTLLSNCFPCFSKSFSPRQNVASLLAHLLQHYCWKFIRKGDYMVNCGGSYEQGEAGPVRRAWEEDREWRCTLCHDQDSFPGSLQTNMLGCSDPKPEDCIWTAFYWKQTFCFLPSIC